MADWPPLSEVCFVLAAAFIAIDARHLINMINAYYYYTFLKIGLIQHGLKIKFIFLAEPESSLFTTCTCISWGNRLAANIRKFTSILKNSK